jgi:3-phosphoshikimate 1-carboxyvinyltransferase
LSNQAPFMVPTVNSLPDLIEIVPPRGPIRACITVPGSKSITNRALILAALRDGETTLHGALWSEDTQVMTECLAALGFNVRVETDPEESCNRSIHVRGLGGHIPRVGSADQPVELFVGNAGTAARFLAAMVCLGQGVCRLRGVPRMHERPQSALFDALRQLGYRIDSANGRLPAVIHGAGRRPGRCNVSVAESSQFASALLLCAAVGGWEVEVVGSNADELPYVEMTQQLLRQFPERGGRFTVEPDASSGSYFVAADCLARLDPPGRGAGEQIEPRIVVNHWPASAWQIDAAFPRFLPLPAEISRERDLGDSIMTGIALAPFAPHPVRFTDLGRLRVQECERVQALRTELTRCGGKVEETGDTLTVYPSALHGAEVETYDDHRMAMCFAILGLKVPGLKIKNPACVKKTFPNFFQKLATAAPRGLGLQIVDPARGRELGVEELFAD